MDIDKLTYGEIKQIAAILKNSNQEQSFLLVSAIGKYVIVRTRNEGINCGRVVMADHTGVVLEEARRIYYHRPKDPKVSWYEGVAETGLHPDSKISGEVSRKYIIEGYSLTICSAAAEQSLKSHEATGN